MTDDAVNAHVDQPEPPVRGLLIREKLYPFPSSFKVTDPVLVKEVSGLAWDPFIAAVTDDEEWLEAHEPPDETLVMVGLIACAVWHVNPSWPRAAVARFVQNLDENDVDVLGVDEAEVGQGEADPSATTETTTGQTPESPPESEQRQD